MEGNLPSLKKDRNIQILILTLCLLLGFSLRFYTFDKKSLWIDEVHTLNDSRDDIGGQIEYYKNPPDLLHPPLFFILTHLFYPFAKPERDLRIIPLIFGTLSIPMIYLLAGLFTPSIALPCTLSLMFMTYHISFSQDGRQYSLLVFLGMVSLYFFLKYLRNNSNKNLILAALFYAISFYTSYASIPFIALSQILWFYQMDGNSRKPFFLPFLILNGATFLLCSPWIIFMALHYRGQPFMDPVLTQELGSFWNILTGVLNDWIPQAPLTVVSAVILALFPLFSKNRKNACLLLAVCFIPIVVVFFFSKLLNFKHSFSSRYVISFIPLFFITLYLALEAIEHRFHKLQSFFRPKFLFVILFILSNITILPLYYRFEKQDFRGLVSYLDTHLRDGDKIYVRSVAYIPGMLYYFGVKPTSRHYTTPLLQWNESEGGLETRIALASENKKFTIIFSTSCCGQFVEDGSRLWIVVGKPAVREARENLSYVFKGYFDGSFCNFRRFPEDASMYLFLWDPRSPGEKGIDLPVE